MEIGSRWKMRKVVYTVVTDDKYELRKFTPQQGWDYICFTNQNVKRKGWTLRELDVTNDPKRLSRKVKILFEDYLPEYDLSIYLDSRFQPRIDLDNLVSKMHGYDMMLMTHPKRACIYQEARFCQDRKIDIPSVIQRQMDRYKNEGFPRKLGLNAGGILVRRHNANLMPLMRIWYDEVVQGSWRDQLSFMYAQWKLPAKIKMIPWNELYKDFL